MGGKRMVDRFAHGDDGFQYNVDVKADFSTNAWYLGPDPKLMEHLSKSLHQLAKYPEPYSESLVKVLAEKHDVKDDNVLVCNGTNETIFLIARLFAGKKSRIISPTFSEYEHACEVNKHQISYSGIGFLNELMQTDFDVFWICNPNNPTGQILDKDMLLSLMKNNPQTLFVIDEAYIDFCLEDVSMETLAGRLTNLIVIRSLTKNNCLPGLRLGYALAHANIIRQLKSLQPPWAVNALAIEAGKYVAEHPRIAFEDLLTYQSLSRQLGSELENLGCEVMPSSTGYFLFKSPVKAAQLKEVLIKKYGLLIRDASNFRTLSPYHVRVASLSAEKNQALVEAMKKCLSSIKMSIE